MFSHPIRKIGWIYSQCQINKAWNSRCFICVTSESAYVLFFLRIKLNEVVEERNSFHFTLNFSLRGIFSETFLQPIRTKPGFISRLPFLADCYKGLSSSGIAPINILLVCTNNLSRVIKIASLWPEWDKVLRYFYYFASNNKTYDYVLQWWANSCYSFMRCKTWM